MSLVQYNCTHIGTVKHVPSITFTHAFWVMEKVNDHRQPCIVILVNTDFVRQLESKVHHSLHCFTKQSLGYAIKINISFFLLRYIPVEL